MTVGPRPRVKICGVCVPSDASYAVEAGAAYVGLIRVPGSPRTRPLAVARQVAGAAGGALKVGVFVDAPTAVVLREARFLGLDVVQLHGAESPEQMEALAGHGFEVWKAVKPGTAEELVESAERYRQADLLLVDGRSHGEHGGVGARFPWDEVEPAVSRLPAGTVLGVAGGLTPDNVAEAVRRFRPALVDVSSGVEAAIGRKDPGLVRAFVDAAVR